MNAFRAQLMQSVPEEDAISQGAFHRFLAEFPFTRLACDLACACVSVGMLVLALAYIVLCGSFVWADWPTDHVCSVRTRGWLRDTAYMSLLLALACVCCVAFSFVWQMLRAAWLAVLVEQNGPGDALLSLV